MLNLIDKKKDQGKLGKLFQDTCERFSLLPQSTHTCFTDSRTHSIIHPGVSILFPFTPSLTHATDSPT